MSDISVGWIEQGWQCPICKRVMSPRQDYCIFCAKQETTISTAGLSTDIDWVKYQSKSFSKDDK